MFGAFYEYQKVRKVTIASVHLYNIIAYIIPDHYVNRSLPVKLGKTIGVSIDKYFRGSISALN